MLGPALIPGRAIGVNLVWTQNCIGFSPLPCFPVLLRRRLALHPHWHWLT
jgi:hypothetical protein